MGGCGHSSTDSIFLQEVEELEKQKKKAKDDKQKKDIEGKLSLKMLEKDLTDTKWVRILLVLLLNVTYKINANIALSLCNIRQTS